MDVLGSVRQQVMYKDYTIIDVHRLRSHTIVIIKNDTCSKKFVGFEVDMAELQSR